MTSNDRDALLRLAIAPPADVVAPADLADAIYRDVLATPQRRALPGLGRLPWTPMAGPLVATLALLALLAVGLVIVALSQPHAPPILSNYHGGPDRAGVMAGPGPSGLVTIRWDVPRPGPLPFNTMPLPIGGRVLVADGSGVIAALDEATGAVEWERDLGAAILGAPAIASDLVFVGTEDGNVVAVDVATSAEAWRRALDDGAVMASLLVADGSLYAATDGGSLVALSPATGEELWRIDVGGAITRGGAYSNGFLYVGATDRGLAAIEIGTRSIRWRADLGRGEIGTPSVGEGRVYAGRGLSGTGTLHDLVAMDVRDGTIAWTFASPVGEQVHMGALAHGRVYATSEDGSATALDPATGAVVWSTPVGDRLTTPATVVGDVLFVASEPHSVTALDAATGRVLWSIDVTGKPTMPAIVDGLAFVGTDLGRVVALGGSGNGGPSTVP